MILVDASVWIDHFRRSDPRLSGLLEARVVLSHPFVIGELACGHLQKRATVIAALETLPSARVVPHPEVLAFVERHALIGRGIGWVDAHLLASTVVTGRVALWSNDKRLAAAAFERGVGYGP